ncbi:MAG: hypothetical protein IJY82_00615 [Oscillospiraceae bacterium]|nr:hypothetical protein [Oscillospiraceae bacterium]
MNITFFGHRDAPQNIFPILMQTLTSLITDQNAKCFYIGTHGAFDRMAIRALSELKKSFPHICVTVVYAYLPKNNDFPSGLVETIYPEGLELTPPKYAISKRNLWMLEHSDTVVTYVIHSVGGAAHFKELAVKKGKQVIELSLTSPGYSPPSPQ